MSQESSSNMYMFDIDVKKKNTLLDLVLHIRQVFNAFQVLLQRLVLNSLCTADILTKHILLVLDLREHVSSPM